MLISRGLRTYAWCRSPDDLSSVSQFQSPTRALTARRWSASTTEPAYRPAGAVYRPRRPTETPLYPVVQHHFETFLAEAQEADPWPSPAEDDPARAGVVAGGVRSHDAVCPRRMSQ
jgi:hypothetical protein